MNFIKKIIDNEVDNSVHLQFQKFSKGEFDNRAVVAVRKTKNKFTISTTSEFANEFVRSVAEELGDEKTLISGAIISTSNLKEEIEYKEIKQFQGVKKYFIEAEMSGKEIISLLDRFPKAFFALTFSSEESKLKIKPKAPKSGKPSSKEGEMPKPNFCRIVTTNPVIGKSFVFETDDFSKAHIVHKFVIEDIVWPKNEKDFAKIRELAKRKGKIIRKMIIDEKEMNSEFDFEA